MAFFAELKRRHVPRVAALYAAVAWLLIQVTDVVSPQGLQRDPGPDAPPIGRVSC